MQTKVFCPRLTKYKEALEENQIKIKDVTACQENLISIKGHLQTALVALDRIIQTNIEQAEESIEAEPDGAEKRGEALLGSLMRNYIVARNCMQNLISRGSNFRDKELVFKVEEAYIPDYEELIPTLIFLEDLIQKEISPCLNSKQKIYYAKYPNLSIKQHESLSAEASVIKLNGTELKAKVFTARGKHTFLNSDHVYIGDLSNTKAQPKAKILLMICDGVTGYASAKNEHTGRFMARELPKLIDSKFQELISDSDSVDLETNFKDAVEQAVKSLVTRFKSEFPIEDYFKAGVALQAATNFAALIETEQGYLVAHLGDLISTISDGEKYNGVYTGVGDLLYPTSASISFSTQNGYYANLRSREIKFTHIAKKYLKPGSHFIAFTDGLFKRGTKNHEVADLFTKLKGSENAQDAFDIVVSSGKELNNILDRRKNTRADIDDQSAVSVDLN